MRKKALNILKRERLNPNPKQTAKKSRKAPKPKEVTSKGKAPLHTDCNLDSDVDDASVRPAKKFKASVAAEAGKASDLKTLSEGEHSAPSNTASHYPPLGVSCNAMPKYKPCGVLMGQLTWEMTPPNTNPVVF
jgi:hypothetical protein